MKKSFIALAVAGALAAPMTASAVDVTYSGNVELRLFLNQKATTGVSKTVDPSSFDTKDRGLHESVENVNFRVDAVEDVGFGEAFASYSIELDGNSETSLSNSDVDNVAVGLRGSFGTVTLGQASDYAESGQLAGDLIFGNQADPDTTLSYAIPAVVPGLTVGLNLVTDTYTDSNVDLSNDASNLASTESYNVQTSTGGLGFGVAYDLDLGGAGALTVGYGQRAVNTTEKVNYKLDNGFSSRTSGLKDRSTTKLNYSSVGLKYSILGVYLAAAQQSVTGREVEVKAGYTGAGKNKSEDVKSTDIEVGYGSGPISAFVRTSTADNYHANLTAGNQFESSDNNNETGVNDDEGFKTTITRIQASYALSDNVSTYVRNQTSVVTKKDQKDDQSSTTFVALSVSF